MLEYTAEDFKLHQWPSLLGFQSHSEVGEGWVNIF
jgi:hypothetical protein